jgi:hypothetical protein
VAGFLRNIAERLFAASLWLHPTPFRRRYGAEMREVFRARQCDAGQQFLSASAWMLVDAFAAAGGAQCRAFNQRGRVRVAAMLALLLFAMLGATHRARLAVALLDRHEQTQAWWGNRPMQTLRAFEREEQRRAAALLEDGSMEQKLVAGLLLSHPSWMGDRTQAHSRELSDLVARGLVSDETADLHFALAICRRVAGCDWRAALADLQRRDHENAATWLLSASALRASDPVGSEAALQRAAAASSFRTFAAPGKAVWLEWSATRPFQPSWWHATLGISSLALHYWRIEEALPAYGLACSPPRVFQASCLAVAQRWHGAADTLRLRAQLTGLLQRERFGRVRPGENPAVTTLELWNRRLRGLDTSREIDPRALAQGLRTAGEVATVTEFSQRPRISQDR